MRRRNDGFTRRALSLTPLIDVIFLLLLFFMLSSTFTSFTEVPLILAGNQQAQTEQAERIQVFVHLSSEGISINGAPTDFADIPASVRKAAGAQAPQILLSVAPETTSQLFVNALARSRSLDNAQVVVLQ